MTPMTPDVPAICASLTKVQRDKMIGWYTDDALPWPIKRALASKGIVYLDNGDQLTPLGLAVRDYLKEQQP